MKATDLLELLTDFHRDKLTMFRRHIAAARHVSNYDFNNAYQYVIAREDTHQTWVRDAILGMGGEPVDVPESEVRVDGKGSEAERSVIAEDRDGAQRFVDKWRSRIERVTNARHRTMLNVVIGETLEHKRFFEQALAGVTDLLGSHDDGVVHRGRVLPTRWVG